MSSRFALLIKNQSLTIEGSWGRLRLKSEKFLVPQKITLQLWAQGECAAQMLEDPKKVVPALVLQEMGDHGNPRSVWGNPRVQGTQGWIPVINLKEATPNREILQQYDVGVEKQHRWLRCPGYMENILKFPGSYVRGCPGRGSEGPQCPVKGDRVDISRLDLDSVLWKQRQCQCA